MGNQANVLIGREKLLLSMPGSWRIKSKSSKPLVAGDRIELQRDKDTWKMLRVLPRENEFTRRMPGRKNVPQLIAANLDQVVIIASAENPATPNGLIDRLLVIAALGNVPAVLLINKIDLADKNRMDYLNRIYRNSVTDSIMVSAKTGENIENFRELIKGRITLLIGSSGVGKSTITNRIDPNLDLKVGEISQATGKGRHVTSLAMLHPICNDGWLIDTPGIRECAPWSMTKLELQLGFQEIFSLKERCKFHDCLHETEYGCAVKSEVSAGNIPKERYESYLKLLNEV
ncbi:ribosome small subunit-dependent GTPase A [bacterium]|nr:ribosome small subunit-dependent GTPase A [bacterium]